MTHGSLQNLLLSQAGSVIVPEVGMGATHLGWTDRHPYTVVKVSASKKTLVLQSDNARRVDTNGMSESQTYEFEADPNGSCVTVTLRKNGRWVEQGQSMRGGAQYRIGERVKYHDYSF